MHTFNSSNIKAASYDPDSRSLEVSFQHGKTYSYANVDPATWDKFRAAKSPGAFHHDRIRGKFDHKLMT